MRAAAPPLILALVVLFGGLVAVAGVGAAGGAPSDDAIENPSEPILVYDIALDENGTGSWTISARFPIGESDQREAFDVLADEYMDGDDDEYLSTDAYEVAAAELQESLDRPMAIEDANRSVDRSNDVGSLVLTFNWTGFAQADNHSVTVGDVFAATERPWLSTLQEDEYLRIHAPLGYAIDTSGMPVSERTVWVDGPADLSETHLRSVFVLEAQMNGDDDDDDAENGGDGEDPSESLILPAAGGAAGILAVLALVLLTGYWIGWAPVSAAVAAARGTEAEAEADEAAPEESVTEETDSEPDEMALLSDEERVLALIENNGGRMKQAAIVDETDWSNAKVSQLLSEMAEEGSVEKLRIGRENLISLPDYE